MPHLPPEARLLFLAIRPRSDASNRALGELLHAPLQWPAIMLLADRERLLPILWYRLREHAADLPAAVVAELRRRASVTEFRMLMLETALERVAGHLRAAGIPVMLLKGAALAKTAYLSFAKRPMGDLDILVARKHAERAWRLVRESGWRVYLEEAGEFYLTHNHLPRLIECGGAHAELEIHRMLLHPSAPFSFDDEEVWHEARAIQTAGTTTLVPANHHQLLHLSIHFAWQHTLSWGVGRTVRDVATLLGAGPTDWPGFVRLAVRTKAATCAYWTLAISRTLCGAGVPSEVLESLRPRQPSAVTRALERAYIMSGLFGSCPSIRVGQVLWSAGIRPRASGHGTRRPWHVGEAFLASVNPGREATISTRLASHLSESARWMQFAKVLTLPRSVV